jgi:hypothetical protein
MALKWAHKSSRLRIRSRFIYYKTWRNKDFCIPIRSIKTKKKHRLSDKKIPNGKIRNRKGIHKYEGNDVKI